MSWRVLGECVEQAAGYRLFRGHPGRDPQRGQAARSALPLGRRILPLNAHYGMGQVSSSPSRLSLHHLRLAWAGLSNGG